MQLVKDIESLAYDTVNDRITMRGWCFDKDGGDYTLEVRVNKRQVAIELVDELRDDIRSQYTEAFDSKHLGFSLETRLNGVSPERLELIVHVGNESEKILNKTAFQLRRWTNKESLIYSIDSRKLTGNTLDIRGWAATLKKGSVKVAIVDKRGKRPDYKYNSVTRYDVIATKKLSRDKSDCGFHIRFNIAPDNSYYLVFKETETGKLKKVPLEIKKIKAETVLINSGIVRNYRFFRANGTRKTAKKFVTKIFRMDTAKYSKWYKVSLPSKEELAAQRKAKFDKAPLISFVVPLYRTPEKFLRDLIESVRAQTYSNWELCLADGSGTSEPEFKELIDKYIAIDKRIQYKDIGKNLGISGNSNVALHMARGEYIALIDHDDVLPPFAAYEIVKEINNNPDLRIIYTDEDKIDMKGRKHFGPHFKSDFNMDMLCSVNYICHLFIIRKDVLKLTGGMRSEFDGAQDHDFILRCAECVEPENIRHIPKILYHWRCHRESTAKDPYSKLYAFEAGIKAIDEHYKRTGIPAHAEHGIKYGMYHTIFEWKKQPLISIIIPNMDHKNDLDKAIRSIVDKSSYKNYEILVIENNSKDKKTFEYYDKIQKEMPFVKVHVWEGINGDTTFNYSSINNFGVSFAKGEYILLLNNDVEIINKDCLEEMMGYCMRDDVGIVGAKLYYNDDTIQHAGVIIGLGGVAGHAFPGDYRDEPGYMGRALYAQDLSSVTGACLLTKKSIFDKVGGLDTGLRVAFNDIDYCLRVRKEGYLVVFNPYAELYHYESKSRGYENTPEKVERFGREIEFFRDRWEDVLTAGDPYYNINLTLDKNDFSLKNLYNG